MSTPGGYFGLGILYGLASLCTLLTPIVLVNYRVVFQAALLASMLLPTGVLWAALRPDPATARVKRAARVMFCVATFVSVFWMGVALINPIQYLAGECPAIRANASLHSDSLDVTVEYRRYDAASGRSVDELLLMQYNVTDTRLSLTQSGRPVSTRGRTETWLESRVRQYQALQVPVCSDDLEAVPQFHYLSHEVQRALHQERSSVRKSSPLLRVSGRSLDADGDGEDGGQSILTSRRHRLDMQEVCLYEYEFTICYIIFIVVLILFQLFTLLWYCLRVKDTDSDAGE